MDTMPSATGKRRDQNALSTPGQGKEKGSGLFPKKSRGGTSIFPEVPNGWALLRQTLREKNLKMGENAFRKDLRTT